MAGENTPLSLLSLGAQVTQNVFQQIDKNLDSIVETQRNTNNAEIAVRMKGLEMAESARMHDAQISSINATNYFRAKEMELKQQLLPMQIESENLRLQAQKAQFQRAKQNQSAQAFDIIVKDFDDSMGYNLLESENKDQAKAYLDIKAKWRSRVARGEEFNADEFKKDVDAINEQFKDAPKEKTEGWDPSTQHLYESISPSLGRAYQLKNPQVEKNRNALASSYYDMTDSGVGDFTSKFGSLYTAEEFGGLGSGRTVYQTNKKAIEQYRTESNRLYRELDNITDEKQRAEMKKRADELAQKSDDLFKQNVQLQTDAAKGKFGVQYSSEPDANTEMKRAVPDLSRFTTSGPPIMGIPAATQSDPQGQTQRDRTQKIAEKFYEKDPETGEVQENELRGLDFKWFSQNRTGDTPDVSTLTRIRTRVENNIKSLDNVEDRFTRDRVESLIGSLQGGNTRIPVSKEFANMAFSNRSLTGDNPVRRRGGEEAMITFGKEDKGLASFAGTNRIKLSSYDDIQKFLGRFETDAERKEAKEEIFAALITASLSHSIAPR